MHVDVAVTGCIIRAGKPSQSTSVLKEGGECGAKLTIKWEIFSVGLWQCEMRKYS